MRTWFKYKGVGYTRSEVRTLTRWLVESQGVVGAYVMPLCDVLYWTHKLSPVNPKTLASLGRVEE